MDILVNKDFLLLLHLNYQSFIAGTATCNSLWIQFGLNVQIYRVSSIIYSQVTSHQYLYRSAEQHSELWSFILVHMKALKLFYFSESLVTVLFCPDNGLQSLFPQACVYSMRLNLFLSILCTPIIHFPPHRCCFLPTALVNSTCKDHFVIFSHEKLQLWSFHFPGTLRVSIFFPKMQLKLMASLLLSPCLLPPNIYYVPYSSRAHSPNSEHRKTLNLARFTRYMHPKIQSAKKEHQMSLLLSIFLDWHSLCVAGKICLKFWTLTGGSRWVCLCMCETKRDWTFDLNILGTLLCSITFWNAIQTHKIQTR